MNIESFKKFLAECDVEWSWWEDNVIMFVENYHLNEFNRLLGYQILSEEGVECHMKYGYVVFEMRDILDYYGIELEEVFPK